MFLLKIVLKAILAIVVVISLNYWIITVLELGPVVAALIGALIGYVASNCLIAHVRNNRKDR